MAAIQPYIHQHFEGQIWKFIIDAHAGLLFAEIRNSDDREVSFASISLTTGLLNFTNLLLPEKWLSGLDGSFNGVLFLHGYQSAQSPAHKGITAVNGLTGDELWSNYSYAISHISINGPWAYNTQIQPVKLFLLDWQTGATLRAYNATIDTEAGLAITLPDILLTLPSEFNNLIDGDVKGNIHYIDHNGFRIVSLHTLKYGMLQQLLIITQNGHLVYEDILIDKIQKLQPEAFILYQNQLIYIKNTSELKILNL